MQVVHQDPISYTEFSRNIQLTGCLPVFVCAASPWTMLDDAPCGTLYVPEEYPACLQARTLERLGAHPMACLDAHFTIRVVRITEVPEDMLGCGFHPEDTPDD